MMWESRSASARISSAGPRANAVSTPVFKPSKLEMRAWPVNPAHQGFGIRKALSAEIDQSAVPILRRERTSLIPGLDINDCAGLQRLAHGDAQQRIRLA